MKIINRLVALKDVIFNLQRELYDARNSKVITGKLLATFNNEKKSINSLTEVEFKVFSQWGDDGIIQYLISKLKIPNKTFVEFGVEYYTESNTRFLLINDNWSGLVIDGSDKHISYIKSDSIYWQYELHAIKAFITAENIETLIDEADFKNEIGILSIDIDGNDYMVWKAIKKYDPSIVIVEYNSAFGDEYPWIVPYDPSFIRSQNDSKKLFWGTSLQAICDLAIEKGYDFVGCNLNGNNAYFIKKIINNNIFTPLTCKQGFIDGKYREAYDNGNPISRKNKFKYLKGMSVYNTRKNAIEIIP